MRNTASGRHKERNQRGKNRAGLTREELRAKRRRERRRIVFMQRIGVACLTVTAAGGVFALIWNLPSMKLNRQLDAGIEYTEEEAYSEAIEAYETALEIDSTSVKAYRCMAGAYLDMEDESHAKQILFEGWKNTQDESLLQYYGTVILNEAVADINNDRVTIETAEKITDVMMQNILKEEVAELMHTVYDRLMQKAEEEKTLDFAGYQSVMDKLFQVYAADGSEEMKALVSKYGMIGVKELEIPSEYTASYLKILEDANAAAETPERSDLIACLQKEREIQEMFAPMFAQFDEGNYEAAKEFIVTDAYTKIRDEFINGTMEYWNGETSIPVSQEYVTIKQMDGKWTFEYPDFKKNEDTAGVITVWGSKMTDNGVQRSYISYEPAKESDSYYPHTEYVISYMNSNLQKGASFEYAMNYHFETRTWTEEGMTTVMIGDWGGPYQWEKTY